MYNSMLSWKTRLTLKSSRTLIVCVTVVPIQGGGVVPCPSLLSSRACSTTPIMAAIFKQECIPVGCVPPGLPDRDPPEQRTPLDRDPLDRDPLGQRPPWPGMLPPLGQRPPLWRRPPGQRPRPPHSVDRQTPVKTSFAGGNNEKSSI